MRIIELLEQLKTLLKRLRSPYATATLGRQRSRIQGIVSGAANTVLMEIWKLLAHTKILVVLYALFAGRRCRMRKEARND